MQIEFRNPAAGALNIVACFSPLFLSDNWQLLLISLELHKFYGASLQVHYIQSILSETMAILKIYEAQKVVSIEPWSKINFDKLNIAYDPNLELNWRNQESAMCDCLLKYKESASFIIFGDIDDVLIPRMSNSFFAEFTYFHSLFPKAAAFLYDRHQVSIKAERNPLNFSLARTISRTKITNDLDDPKSIAIPSRIHSTFIHWPGIVLPGYNIQRIKNTTNFMLHLRHWQSEVIAKNISELKISKNVTREIDRTFHNFVEKYAIKEFMDLPSRNFYFPLIEQCYNAIFYSKAKQPDFCPTPMRCNVTPVIGVRCTLGKNIYKSNKLGGITVHTVQWTGYEEFDDGCRIK
ncbi:unnamed protein product [Dracunculus medinensis]|uniref:Glycosyltransferase family 92 protein n=1 Tax=Dracunculus medinensis TaxID=318479 RepID=A0A3P7PX41_DRAME|nr:unnamed protein product [Dracunculus medinensis]